MYLKLLEKNIKDGRLHLHLANGKEFRFGNHGLEAHWYVDNEKTMNRIARDPEFQLGQTYMEGLWHCGESNLRDLLSVLRANFVGYEVNPWLKPLGTLLQQWNKISRSYANVAHHYDIKEEVFRKFLDKEMFYSCAYFDQPDYNLEQAQQAKARHIANKLLLKSGQKVLDIGCGWGSLAFYIAEHSDVEVVGITLSREQLSVAQAEAKRRGLSNVRFEFSDYREHQGRYDRIVSVGMFEHVGKPYYDTFFQRVNEMLKQNGVALIHTIGRSGPAGLTNPWIRKYIFPGGSTPALSEMAAGVESSSLMATDVEVLRLHYAQTLHLWDERFQTHRDEISAIMGDEFCRMWEFYLCISEVAFLCSDLVVFQYQLTKQHNVVPTTRDYLYGEERGFKDLQSYWHLETTAADTHE